MIQIEVTDGADGCFLQKPNRLKLVKGAYKLDGSKIRFSLRIAAVKMGMLKPLSCPYQSLITCLHIDAFTQVCNGSSSIKVLRHILLNEPIEQKGASFFEAIYGLVRQRFCIVGQSNEFHSHPPYLHCHIYFLARNW
ncbi:hypothetical protein D3C73_749130 [compost metagenome]